MKTVVAAAAFLALTGASGSAHRLDEYLQGTIVSVGKDRVTAQMTLTPGVSVFPAVRALIDSNGDGVISETEQRAYARHVLQDLSLAIDGEHLTPRLVSLRFPGTGEMREGLGEIQLDFEADLPAGTSNRTLIVENHHQSRIAAYQVNCLVPRDRNIRVSRQERNYTQSLYRLEYVQDDARSGWAGDTPWRGRLGWSAGMFCFLVVLRYSGFYKLKLK